MTLREFNNDYQLYKDDFDMELSLTLNRTTYAKAKQESMRQEEWF